MICAPLLPVDFLPLPAKPAAALLPPLLVEGEAHLRNLPWVLLHPAAARRDLVLYVACHAGVSALGLQSMRRCELLDFHG